MQFIAKTEKNVLLCQQYKNGEEWMQKFQIKNRTCYYIDDIIEFEDFDFDNSLIVEKSHKNILIYNMAYKTLIGAKLSHIRFNINKIGGFIRVFDGSRYLVLFGPEQNDAIYNKIRYLISQKSGIAYVLCLTIMQKSKLILMILYLQKKTLTLHNVIKHINLVLNEDQNHCY